MVDEARRERPTWLRIVRTDVEPPAAREPRQMSLFLPGPIDCQMAVLRIPKLLEPDFLSILDEVQPVRAVDTRSVKRFDIGRLRRQDVFREFERRTIVYVEADLPLLEDGTRSFASMDKHLNTLGTLPSRIVVLADMDEIVEALRLHYTRETAPNRRETWAVRVLPAEIGAV